MHISTTYVVRTSSPTPTYINLTILSQPLSSALRTSLHVRLQKQYKALQVRLCWLWHSVYAYSSDTQTCFCRYLFENTPGTQKQTEWKKAENIQTQSWRYKTIAVIKRHRQTTVSINKYEQGLTAFCPFAHSTHLQLGRHKPSTESPAGHTCCQR